MNYKLKLDVFEGPLDLLLYLIKKNDLDICSIPIATVTDQYLEYIDMMKMLDLEVVGDFLVMAATLIQIKSRMLLPPDPAQEEEEDDPRDELVRRLQEYKMFKEIAEQLKEKELIRQNFYSRSIDEETRKEWEEDSKEVYFEANLFDLINAFTKALRRFQEQPVYEIRQEEFTVEMKIHDVLHSLLKNPMVMLTEFFNQAHSKIEIIVTFMAILELIRMKEIKIMQKRAFADIEVVRNRDNVLPPDAPEEDSVSDGEMTEGEEVLEPAAEESAQAEEPPQVPLEDQSSETSMDEPKTAL